MRIDGPQAIDDAPPSGRSAAEDGGGRTFLACARNAASAAGEESWTDAVAAQAIEAQPACGQIKHQARLRGRVPDSVMETLATLGQDRDTRRRSEGDAPCPRLANASARCAAPRTMPRRAMAGRAIRNVGLFSGARAMDLLALGVDAVEAVCREATGIVRGNSVKGDACGRGGHASKAAMVLPAARHPAVRCDAARATSCVE